MPNPSYYDIDNMHKEARDKFLQWYEIHWQDPFDMERELLEYCHSDVDILLNVCWKFRKLFMDITGSHHPIDPFDYITIASLCMGTFHAKFLPKGWMVLYKKDAWNKCTGYGTANVHGSRPENCMEMHPSKSTWGMVAGHKWTGRRLSPIILSSLP